MHLGDAVEYIGRRKALVGQVEEEMIVEQPAEPSPLDALGGGKTEIEFQVGLYIDPENGDIYATNNDTVNKMRKWFKSFLP